ncbi:hypothetical protein GGF46_002082 [Coemansia sp. RSA 552]|nr:hypothetical protein GGF46_002082 [Coemansia sp. RSA 552]
MSLLSSMFRIDAKNPGTKDTITIGICAGLYGITTIMLVYAWFNRKYRPIRAKNLTWTSLMFLSAFLWYVGNVYTNGHASLTGAGKLCKLWINWFRVGCTFVFASLTIVRFYALYAVFVLKKPFTLRSNLTAGAFVIIPNVAYCLVFQLVTPRLTLEYIPAVEACNVAQSFRIAAVTFQWILWACVGVLIYRLRNIQSSFNEFHESIAIFCVIIALLVASSVINLHYEYYILEQPRRIAMTVIDASSSNLVIWLILAYPVFQSIFNRRKYEQKWLERLADESSWEMFAKTADYGMSGIHGSKLDIRGSTDSPMQTFTNNNALLEPTSLFASNQGAFSYNSPLMLNNQLEIHPAILNSPSIFASDYGPAPGGMHVL